MFGLGASPSLQPLPKEEEANFPLLMGEGLRIRERIIDNCATAADNLAMNANHATPRFVLTLLLAWWLAACASPTPIPTPPVLNIPSPPASEGASGEGAAPTTAALPTLPPSETTAATAGATPTAEASPTPEEALPTATAVPTPATNPAVQSTTTGLPPISQDLYLLAQGSLVRWNHLTGQIETLLAGADPASRVQDPENPVANFVGDITHVAISPDGQRATAARLTSQEQTRQPDEALGFDRLLLYQQHEILFVDLVSGEQWVMVARADNVQGIAISPNAERVAFVASGLSGETTPTAPEETAQVMHVLTTGGGSGAGAPQAVGTCVVGCFGPLWHLESNLLVWADHAALWLFNTAASQPEKLLDHRYNENDIEWYWPVAWANNGRYLLLDEFRFESQSSAVYDVPSQTLLAVPNTGNFITPYPTEVQWMPDDRLLIARSNPQPQLELWRVDLDGRTAIQEETRVVGATGQGLIGARHLTDGRFAFALSTAEASAGTYLLTSLSEEPLRVNGIPPTSPADPFAVPHVLWAADGSGAWVSTSTAAYYAPASGGALYEISAVWGYGVVQTAVWR